MPALASSDAPFVPHLLQLRDGAFAYTTLSELARQRDRSLPEPAELDLVARDDPLCRLAVAAFGYSASAVRAAYARAQSNMERSAVAGNGYPMAKGWCGSVLSPEESAALLQADPTAAAAFAANPHLDAGGLLNLLAGTGPMAGVAVDWARVLGGLAANPVTFVYLANAFRNGQGELGEVFHARLGALADDVGWHGAVRAMLLGALNGAPAFEDLNAQWPRADLAALTARWDVAPPSPALADVRILLRVFAKPTLPDTLAGMDPVDLAAGCTWSLRQGETGTWARLAAEAPDGLATGLELVSPAHFDESAREALVQIAYASNRPVLLRSVFSRFAVFETPESIMEPLPRGEFRTARRAIMDNLQALRGDLDDLVPKQPLARSATVGWLVLLNILQLGLMLILLGFITDVVLR